MVSIIIPVYNCKLYVEKMIQSVLEQTYSDFELLLVDDGSTDGTLEMMYQYQRNDTRIRVFKREREPKGAQTCRNIGFENSNRTYIVFFDSDDLISSTCLQTRISFIEANNNLDFAIFPAKSFSDEKFIKTLFSEDYTWGVDMKKNNLLLEFLNTNYPFIVVTNIYKRKSLIENNIFWDEKLKVYQDFDFNISTILKGLKFKFSYSEQVVFDYFYRVKHSPKSTCSNPITRIKLNSTIYLFSKTIAKLNQYNLSKKYHNAMFLFVKLYFKRIILAKEKGFLKEYFIFCNNNYSNIKVLKLKIIASCSISIRHPFFLKLVFTSLLCLFFPKTELNARVDEHLKRLFKRI